MPPHSKSSAQPLRVITLYQPWASLFVWDDPITGEPEKPDETRSWPFPSTIPLPCWLAVHAGKSTEYLEDCKEEPYRSVVLAHGIKTLGDFPRGAIVGVVKVVRCQRTERAAPGLSDSQFAFGDYSPGRYAWRRTRSFLLPEPIPYRGAQGIRTVDPETTKRIREQLTNAYAGT